MKANLPGLSLKTVFLAGLFLFVCSTAMGQSMYADPKAGQMGDVITVILAERNAVQRESSYDNKSTAGAGLNSSADSGALSKNFAVDARFSHDNSGSKQMVQSDLLHGYITALVTGRDSTGNLVIQGERKINVNGSTHIMKISGVVRRMDVRFDNTVYSYQIANAQVEYKQGGLTRKFLKPGTFLKLGLAVLVGSAVMSVSK